MKPTEVPAAHPEHWVALPRRRKAMLVSTGGRSYLRGMVAATASRNGSFISFQFACEGITKHILVLADDIAKCSGLINHGDEIEISVDLDQSINIETMVDEFNQRQRWLKDLIAA